MVILWFFRSDYLWLYDLCFWVWGVDCQDGFMNVICKCYQEAVGFVVVLELVERWIGVFVFLDIFVCWGVWIFKCFEKNVRNVFSCF